MVANSQGNGRENNHDDYAYQYDNVVQERVDLGQYRRIVQQEDQRQEPHGEVEQAVGHHIDDRLSEIPPLGRNDKVINPYGQETRHHEVEEQSHRFRT